MPTMRRRPIPKSQWRPISRDEAKRYSAIARDMLAGRESTKPATVTGQQARAARVALGLALDDLAARADVSAGAVDLFEAHDKVDRFDRERIVGALQYSGAAFVANGDLKIVAFRG